MRTNKKGFTLIELLVVVAIIGILAAIAIPQFSKYRTRAYNSAANSDLKNLQTAWEGFYTDYAQYPDAQAVNDKAYDNADFSPSANVLWGSTAGANNQSYGAAAKSTPGDILYDVTSDDSIIGSTDDTKGDKLVAGDIPAAP